MNQEVTENETEAQQDDAILEEVKASLSDIPSTVRSQVLRHLMGEYALTDVISLANDQYAMKTAGTKNPFLARMVAACDIKPETKVPMIFPGIYQGCLTHLSAVTGSGKSTLVTYNIAINAAKGEEIWGIGFDRPYRVLCLDPENNGFIRYRKLDRLEATDVPNLFYHDGRDADLKDAKWLSWLTEAAQEKEIDLIILDDHANLFFTVSENSNEEGIAEYRALKRVAEDCGAAILVIHHTGKDENNWMGRGNSALAGMAHVVLHMTVKKPSEDEVDDDYDPNNNRQANHMVRMEFKKDRPGGIRASMYWQAIGNDRFARISSQEWRANISSDSNRESALDDARKKAYQIAMDYQPVNGEAVALTQADLVKALMAAEFTRSTAYGAVNELIKAGALVVKNGPKNSKLIELPNLDEKEPDGDDKESR